MRITRRHACAGLLSGTSYYLLIGGASQAVESTRPIEHADSVNPAWTTLPPTPTLPKAKRSGLVSVNNVSIYFAQFGDGPPVLLLHGGLGSSVYWGHQVRELAKSYSVIVMDTRGHGRSPVMSSSFSYALFAEDVAGLFDMLKIPSLPIVGWSDGAITGLQLAISRPDRVSKLFAFGANSSVSGLKKNGSKSRTFQAYAERCKAEYAQMSPSPGKWPELLSGLRPMWRGEPKFTKQMFGSIKTPTAISDGEYDELIQREDVERMSREIPGARLTILPNVSHFAMLQNPKQFNAALISFLSSEDGTARLGNPR
jgi:pimeloyl-ACP methyl ester carboxylesterase